MLNHTFTLSASRKLSAKPLTNDFLQRKCACGQHKRAGDECPDCKQKRFSLQRQAAMQADPVDIPPIVHQVLRSPGQPLDPATRAYMEPRFGHDFSQVRVHTGARAAQSAQEVNALAYTVGEEVVFGSGQYTPATSAGKKLLAHELAHTLQQTGKLETAFSISQPGDRYEREAEHVSQIVTAGRQAPKIAGTNSPAVLRRVSAKDEADWEKRHPEGRVEEEIEKGRTIFILWNFAVGSNDLKPEHQEVLLKIAKRFKGAFEDFVLEIDGYTSSTGSRAQNKIISANRANTVKAFLEAAGMDRVVTRGFGESSPWVPNTSAENMARNRRVVIRARKKKELPPKILEEAGCAARLADANVVTLGAKVIRRPAPKAPKDLIQVTLNDYVTALGTAELIGGKDCDKYTLGFLQIARRDGYQYAVYHSPSVNKDFKIERDLSALPAMDVDKTGDIWYTSEPPKCLRSGVSKPVEVLFTDKPSTGFLNTTSIGLYPKSLVWNSPFLNIFSVICPDGSVRHLKSFYWTVRYCEQFDAPAKGEILGKSIKRTDSVEIEAVKDGAPSEPGISLAGKPAKKTANQIVKSAKSKTQIYGEYDVIC